MKKYKLGLILSMLIWGSIGIFVKNINFTSAQIALVRSLVGSIFLLNFCIFSKNNLSLINIKKNLHLLILCGVCLAFNWIFLFQSYTYSNISTATICYYMSPIFVMFLSPFIFKEKLNFIKVCCIILAMTGMLCIVGVEKTTGGNNIIGIFYGLGAACFYTGVVILNKFLENITGRDSAVVQLSVSILFLLPYVYFTDGISFSNVSVVSLLLLLIVGIVHTGIAYLIYFSVIQKLSSQTVAIYSYIDPIFAILMSAIMLNESMSLIQIVGGVLIIGSTFVSELFNNRFKNELDIVEETEYSNE